MYHLAIAVSCTSKPTSKPETTRCPPNPQSSHLEAPHQGEEEHHGRAAEWRHCRCATGRAGVARNVSECFQQFLHSPETKWNNVLLKCPGKLRFLSSTTCPGARSEPVRLRAPIKLPVREKESSFFFGAICRCLWGFGLLSFVAPSFVTVVMIYLSKHEGVSLLRCNVALQTFQGVWWFVLSLYGFCGVVLRPQRERGLFWDYLDLKRKSEGVGGNSESPLATLLLFLEFSDDMFWLGTKICGWMCLVFREVLLQGTQISSWWTGQENFLLRRKPRVTRLDVIHKMEPCTLWPGETLSFHMHQVSGSRGH